MKKVCIDASIVVAWLSYDKFTDKANTLWKEWSKEDVEILGPPIFHTEVMSVLLQQVASRKILPEESEEAFSICFDIPVRIVDGLEMYRTAWRLAKELNLPSCYDTQYLAVAVLEECEYWTSDRTIGSLIQRDNIRVKWLGDYGSPTQEVKKAVKDTDITNTDIPGLWREI